MLTNYLTQISRSILRNPLISMIEILGLGVGMSIGLMIIVIISSQLQYDKFHPKSSRTFRVTANVKGGNGERAFATAPLRLASELKQYSPIEDVLSISPTSVAFLIGDEKIRSKAAFTDNSFFDMFGFPLIKGSSRSALKDPFSVVLSETEAARLFGSIDQMGRVVQIDGLGDFTITGIFRNEGMKSHIDYDVLVSSESLASLRSFGANVPNDSDWSFYDNSYVYALLNSPGDYAQLSSILSRCSTNASNELRASEIKLDFQYQRIDRIVPSNLAFESGTGVSTTFIAIMTGIAVLVLLLSLINYFNLSTARLFNRSREIGIRKAAGATRIQLIIQLLIDSIGRAFIALAISYVLIQIIPWESSIMLLFNSANLSIPQVTAIILYVAAVGIIGGIFPALVLSKIPPVTALTKLSSKSLLRETVFGRSLTVFQFSVSLTFLILLAVMYKQTLYMRFSDYGFNRDNLLVLDLRGGDGVSIENQILQHSNVLNTFLSSEYPGIGHAGTTISVNKDKGASSIPIDYFSITPSFLSTLDIGLLAGENLHGSADQPGSDILLNALAAKRLGFEDPGDAIGKTVVINDSVNAQVKGIVENFHYRSFKFPIGPLALQIHPKEFRYLYIKVHDTSDPSFVAFVEKLWKERSQLHPELKSYSTMFDERHSYNNDISTIASFAVMAMVISYFGLFGVVLQGVQKRVREVGIRKILGASSRDVLVLISATYIKPVLISIALGSALGIFSASEVLGEFSYKTDVSFDIIAICAVTMSLVAFLIY